MSTDHTGNRQPSIDAEEHDTKNISVKKTGLFGYDSSGDEYVRIAASDNGDGTWSLKTSGGAGGGGDASAANQVTIIGHVDGIEGLLTTIDSDTSTLAGAVSGTEVQVDIVSGAQTDALTDTELRASPVVVDLGANNDVTVTGTVDLGATDNAVLDSIDSAVNGTLTVASHAVTNAGTFAVQESGDLLTEMRIMNGAMAMLVDDAGSGTTYQGWAEPGTATSAASWRIRRIVVSGSPEDTTITFADGDRSFDNIWDNRAALSYS